jgi:predicted GNAT family N-acyltransferase
MEKMTPEILLTTIAYQSAEYQQMVQLRYDILRAPLGLQFSKDYLAKDANSILIGAFVNGEIIGCCQLDALANDVYQLRQMAVANQLQNSGVGTKIVQFAENFARQQGGKRIMLHARDVAVGFYAKLGYTVVSDTFIEVGIPHVEMAKELSVL